MSDSPLICNQIIQIATTEEFKKRVEAIAAAEDRTVPDTIRRALGLYAMVHENEKQDIFLAFVRLGDEHEKPEILETFSL